MNVYNPSDTSVEFEKKNLYAVLNVNKLEINQRVLGHSKYEH
jgi:hypothetical protein